MTDYEGTVSLALHVRSPPISAYPLPYDKAINVTLPADIDGFSRHRALHP